MVTLELTDEEFTLIRLAVARLLSTPLDQVNIKDLKSLIEKFIAKLKEGNHGKEEG